MIKQIEGYSDYFISDKGEVFSTKYGPLKKLKPRDFGSGYVGVTLCNKGHYKQIKVHRLVAQTFIPNPDNKPCVNHKDGNKQNNCIDNLEWSTHKENNQYFRNVQKPNGLYEKQSEKSKSYMESYCERHQEEIKVCKKRYREKHREELRNYRKQYRERINKAEECNAES